MTIDYKRQTDILNPKDITQTIHIMGLGTIGSFSALAIAKTGSPNVSLWDFDTIESHNLPNQFYLYNQVGSLKSSALESLLKELNPEITISTINMKIAEENHRDIIKVFKPNDIVILAFDNLDSRRLVFDAIKYVGINFIDGRMAKEEFRIFSGNTNSPEFMKKYEESLNPQKVIEVPCGERSICYNAMAIASFIASIVKKIVKHESIPFELSFSLKNYQSILEW